MYKDRHARIEKVCEYCGHAFIARVERVNKGQGRFCSLKCANAQQKKEGMQTWGYEKGNRYWNGERWMVSWMDESGQHNTTYAKWWWTINVGEVPIGYVVSYIDNNYENIDSSNFQCIEKSKINKKNAQFSIGKFGPKWDKTQRNKISDRMRKRWADGKYDHTKGENNYNWRGGSSKKYPKEFYEIRDFILGRDNYVCQVCGNKLNIPQFAHVHHRDGNKKHNNQENLLSLCIWCHAKVHKSKGTSSPAILSLRSELEWAD